MIPEGSPIFMCTPRVNICGGSLPFYGSVLCVLPVGGFWSETTGYSWKVSAGLPQHKDATQHLTTHGRSKNIWVCVRGVHAGCSTRDSVILCRAPASEATVYRAAKPSNVFGGTSFREGILSTRPIRRTIYGNRSSSRGETDP